MTCWRYRGFSVPFDIYGEETMCRLFSAVRRLNDFKNGNDIDGDSICGAVSEFFNSVFGKDAASGLFSDLDTVCDYIDAYKSFAEFASDICREAVRQIRNSEVKYLHCTEACG